MSPDLESVRVASALTHPTRIAILTMLKDGAVLSPSKMAEEVDEPLGNFSYHCKKLVDLECLELVRTEPRRGAVEHFYRSTGKVSLMSDANIALDRIATIVGPLLSDGELDTDLAIGEVGKVLFDSGRLTTV